ncbi:DUF4184 family protein [Hymenobacter jeollabukensis]|uniref:DUF4184 family protein n=1 Tax=Hymenobacter jeollabukensis TaxID=2025313 RepID=A0A5R8WPU2_9BACT|nr:DUF4184 family protein [Hymenobacter jeollabukensis]TLM91880.1 DUF4184 family protein [Hymenobacter jeollabukensis]
MPFTFSHPAAAVPLARPLRLPMSALWVGSLSPDFIYFLQLKAEGEFGHSFWGLFFFCLPLSLVVLWLWHAVVKGPAAALLPAWAGRRAAAAAAAPFAFGPGRRLGQLAAAILIGAITHNVWDAFTHTDGWVVEHWPLLLREVPFPYFEHMPICKLLQLLSTAVGGALLAWWAWQWLRRQPVGTAPALRHRLVWTAGLLLGAVALSIAYNAWQLPPLTSYAAVRWVIVQSIVASCSFLWLGLIGFSLWYQLKAKKAGPEEPASAPVPQPEEAFYE